MTFRRNILYLSIFLSAFFGNAQESAPKKASSRAVVSKKSHVVPEASKIDSLWSLALHSQLKTDPSLLNFWEAPKIEDSLKQYAFADSLDRQVFKDRLSKLNKRTPIDIEYNETLENLTSYFLRKKYDLFQNLINLSAYYFPMIEQKLDQYNLPMELKYLAIIESALNPKAKSRVGASGLWQFMYGTGKLYGLQVNSYIDDRYDPEKSTDAACRYLTTLHNLFGDWALALAAYNTGPGNVSKAMRRAGGYNNFWALRRYMPRETSGYFPLFVVSMYIFEYAKELGLKPNKNYPHYIETDVVMVKEKMNFEQISRLTNTDSLQVAFLNPMYKLSAIPASENNPYPLRLPVRQIGRFISDEDAIYETVRKENVPLPIPKEFKGFASPSGVYIVKKGDTLWSIARLFPGVSANDLMKWNKMPRNSKIRPGMKIKVCASC